MVSKPIKMFVVTIVVMIIAAITWLIFKPAMTIGYPDIWIWSFVMLLLLGIGFRVVTNSYFGSMIVSYLFIGFALIALILFAGLKLYSLNIFHKEAVLNLVSVTEADYKEYKMEDSFFETISSAQAANTAAKDISVTIDNASDYELSDSSLQYVDGKLYYVFYMKQISTGTMSNVILVDANTAEVEIMETEPFANSIKEIEREISDQEKNTDVSGTKFVVSDDKIPYWVSYRYGPVVSIMGTKGVVNSYLTNAITGEIQKFTKESLPEWVDCKIDVETKIDHLNIVLKTMKKDYSVVDYTFMNRAGTIYAYLNFGNKNESTGAGFMNLTDGSVKIYLQDAVSVSRILECVDSWEIASGNYTYDIPYLTNVNGKAGYIIPTYLEDGTFQEYLLIDGEEGSYYVAGEWDEVIEEFSNRFKLETETDTSELEDESDVQEPEQTENSELDISEEGISFNLIAGYVESYEKKGDVYAVKLAVMTPTYYIPISYITDSELEAAKTNGITLQYPIEYDGQMAVYNCVPVNITLGGE